MFFVKSSGRVKFVWLRNYDVSASVYNHFFPISATVKGDPENADVITIYAPFYSSGAHVK